MNNELQIEDAIIKNTGALGFPGASAIRRVRSSPDSGVIDLTLIPAEGAAKLILIEAKDEWNARTSIGRKPEPGVHVDLARIRATTSLAHWQRLPESCIPKGWAMAPTGGIAERCGEADGG